MTAARSTGAHIAIWTNLYFEMATNGSLQMVLKLAGMIAWKI